jgi:molybdopterin/thiamine biosynthesis adenylyltransferase/proteasome lid subunit RPN8/RPN11
MFRYIAFTDTVLASVERDVAAHPPERGGALLGPVGMPVITRFLYDAQAATSGATFKPSRGLQAQVARIEQQDRTVELKGILHSHPDGMDYPSGGDHYALADSLRGAPWLGRFVAPIVTHSTRASAPHEVALPSGIMSVYISELVSSGRVDVQGAQVHVLPVTRDIMALARTLDGKPLPRGSVDVDGVIYLSAGIELPGLDLQLLLPANYPMQAPLVLAVIDRPLDEPGRRLLESFGVEVPGSGAVALPLKWDLSVAETERLTCCFHEAVAALSRTGDTARKGIRQRLDGVESAGLASRSVLIAGAGSGGSLTADALSRSGVEKFIVIDADDVAPENLSRSVYRSGDLGQKKVTALARHLREINPMVTCQTVDGRIQDLPRETLDDMVRSVDLVVAATDDLAAQRTLNHFTYARGVPAVFGGVYARGQAGEVVFTVPSITRCYRCTTTSRHQDGSQGRQMNYGTGRLNAEPALGVDIQHIVTASVKLAIGLLQLEDDSVDSSSRDLLYGALAAGYNYLILSTVPSYGFFDEIFAKTPGQYGYQSVWLGATGDVECTVCGSDPVDPLHTPGTGPVLANLRPTDEPGDGLGQPATGTQPR